MSVEQDKLRMFGAKAERHVILFKRALLVAKKRDDVTMSVKAFIEVTLPQKDVLQEALAERPRDVS